MYHYGRISMPWLGNSKASEPWTWLAWRTANSESSYRVPWKGGGPPLWLSASYPEPSFARKLGVFSIALYAGIKNDLTN